MSSRSSKQRSHQCYIVSSYQCPLVKQQLRGLSGRRSVRWIRGTHFLLLVCAFLTAAAFFLAGGANSLANLSEMNNNNKKLSLFHNSHVADTPQTMHNCTWTCISTNNVCTYTWSTSLMQLQAAVVARDSSPYNIFRHSIRYKLSLHFCSSYRKLSSIDDELVEAFVV